MKRMFGLVGPVDLPRTHGFVVRAGLVLLVGAAVPATTAAPARASSLVPLDLCEMKPVFMEEFDTQSIAPRALGPARWTAHTPWNGDFGDARFADPVSEGPFAVKDGVLRITARKNPDGRWQSGLIAASDGSGAGTGVRYGYFESRIMMPPGPGTWPAFWVASIRPQNDKGPNVEIDAVEYYGHATDSYFAALHVWYADRSRTRQETLKIPVSDGSLITGFHSYGIRVAADVVTFYLDRKPVWQRPTPPEHTRPLFPLVNLALGSGYPIDQTPNPSTMAIDYVHVYALDPAGRQSRCRGATEPTQ